MILSLILIGTVLVPIAMFNKVPRLEPARSPAARRRPVSAAQASAASARPRGPLADQVFEYPRLRFVPARLTENGRALLTTVGGSALIVAFFLAL